MGELFDAVRDRVTAQAAAMRYGLEIGRNGRAQCPWHNDKHPDLTFYDDGRRCYCHACHKGGDAITLTAHLFSLSPLDAARKLNSDFALSLDETGHAPVPAAGPSPVQIRAELKTWRNRRFADVCEVEQQAKAWLAHNRNGWDSPGFLEALTALALAQDELEWLQVATLEDLAASRAKGGDVVGHDYISA